MNETSVLISIQPQWCAKIAQGFKTLEIRKTRPKLKTPFKCYIYCTNQGRPLVYGDVRCWGGYREEYVQTYGYSREDAERIWDVYNGRVMGEFICDVISEIELPYNGKTDGACLTVEEMNDYSKGKQLYGWHISKLDIYDTPVELSNFYVENDTTHDCPTLTRMKRPPQSWCYVEGRIGDENT